ncbi:MAG: fibronectin type III domain-containing protein [Candidatus Poribacteria bacterium]|nr:fibronectin type III domain-containing protein [Candidatus Poribacteria bacterium]
MKAAPGAPRTLNVQRVDDTATLTWTPPGNPEAIIRYEYSDDGGSTWTSTDSTDTTYTVTGLKAGETYTFLVRAVYVDGTTSRIISPRSPSSNAAVLTFPKPKRRILLECPVGWQRTDGFAQPNPRVLIYEVNLEMDLQNRISIYKPDYVAIYVHPDEGLENLDGWKLHVAVPYNHHREYLLTAENSVVVDSQIEGIEGGFAFIESPEENPFPMVAMGFTGATVPGFDYRLYDDTGRKIDFGIACYKQGGIFQTLKDMEDPRVLRNVLLESLDWDAVTYIRSEWTVPAPAPAAPSLVKKTVVGTWANLKKQ